MENHMQEKAIQLIENYYQAFNKNDMPAFFDLLDEDVIHDINQGEQEIGKTAFKRFMQQMNRCYQERITHLIVFANQEGSRASAEFYVEGVYSNTDKGFPVATNQTYRLPAGAFFEIKNEKITRVTNYYNVKQWMRLIST